MDRKNQIDVFAMKAGLSSGLRSRDTIIEADFVASQLRLMPGARILDLPCGNGRHALHLARKGYCVTGVDVSRDCIEIAQAKSLHRNIEYKRLVVNSVRKLEYEFEGVISLLSCIGYLATDSENVTAVRSLLSVLRNGGRIILSTANSSFVRRLGNNVTVFDTKRYAIERFDKFDPATKCLNRRFRVLDKRSGMRSLFAQRRRIYSKTEMVELLRTCGIGSIRCFADFDGGPFLGSESPHVIYVGTKHG